MSVRQGYISNELTHFVGKNLKNDEERFQLLIDIVSSGLLLTSEEVSNKENIKKGFKHHRSITIPKGFKFSDNSYIIPQMVCFCDIPINEFGIHMQKYSRFGLAFSKYFLVKEGANPVSYYVKTIVDDYNFDGCFQHYEKLLGIIKKYSSEISKMAGYENDEIKKISESISRVFDYHIFSYSKVFKHNKDEDDLDNYYMEREWRIVGSLEFEINNVKRIILPVGYAQKFYEKFPGYEGHMSTVEE